MTTPVPQPFELNRLESGKHISPLIENLFDAPVTSCDKVGQGFYAHVFRVSLEKAPKTVIVKCHAYAGRSAKEKAQLETLRKHAIVNVPQVYAIHFESEDFPCEALTMAYIPGIKASEVQFPDGRTKTRFVDRVVENLLAWHSVSNRDGFGELEGPFHKSWLRCFKERIARYHQHIHQAPRRAAVSQYVMRVVDASFEGMERIFEHAHERSSLVHSDYNAWNMMVDPATYELTGIIDPIDAGWSDYEIDLFHLPNSRPDLGLLERYLKESRVDAPFWLRFKFYRFWDDVKHYVRMGWYQEDRFRGYAKELETAMNECLE